MIIDTVAELRAWRALYPRKRVGFVPTMGALHEGHLSLIRRARRENDVVVVSIFVNPTQFGPGEDFATYPRTLDADVAASLRAGADVVFAPAATEMYHRGARTLVSVTGSLTGELCGASRPGHFRGVTTVVAMLFNIVTPTHAYFGQKDAQQVLVVQRMVRDLHMDVDVVVCPIVREPDGLALSSRNARLTPQARQEAVCLHAGLQAAESSVRAGERRVAALVAAIRHEIAAASLADIDYVEIRDADTLEPLDELAPGGRALAAVAVRFGDVRLIDNTFLTV